MSGTFDASLPHVNGTFRLGDAFGRAFGAFGRNFVPFMILAIIGHIPRFISAYFFPEPTPLEMRDGLWVVWRWLMVTEIVILFCTSLTCAMIIYGVVQDQRGQSFSVRDCLQKAFDRFLPLTGIAFCVGFATIFAAMALVIPGFIVATIYYVAQPVCVVEKSGVFASMSRSAQLTKGFRGRVFVIILIIGVIGYILGIAQHRLFAPYGTAAVNIAGVAIGVVVSALTATLVGVAYYLLRVAKEGVDIEKIASVFE